MHRASHLRSTEVHVPLAHARLPLPQDCPVINHSANEKRLLSCYEARTIGSEDIRRTRRGITRADLRGITLRVLRRATYLLRWCKPTALRTTSTAVRITHGVVLELARRGVAAVGVDTEAGVTVFPGLDDAVAAHLERDGLPGGVSRVDETGGVAAGSHHGAWDVEVRLGGGHLGVWTYRCSRDYRARRTSRRLGRLGS